MRHLGIRYWVLAIVVVMLVAGCEPTETPTPTVSPLPTLTVESPLATPTPPESPLVVRDEVAFPSGDDLRWALVGVAATVGLLGVIVVSFVGGYVTADLRWRRILRS